VSAARLIPPALVAAAFVAAAAAPAAAAAEPRDQVVLSGTVEVPRGREVGEVVILTGSAVIDGVAFGDVVVLNGDISVNGQVSGSVIAVDGTVSLGPNAQVGGDVTSRGEIELTDGAKVDGRVRQHAAFTWRRPISAFGRFASWLAVTVSTLLLGLGLVLVVPRGVDAAFAAARGSPLTALGWGALLAVGVPVLSIISIASLVGLPLGLAVLLAFVLVAFVGYALAAYVLGCLLWRRSDKNVLAFVIGWAILRAVALIPFVSGLTWAAGAVFGVGAAAVATWRVRAVGGRHREGKIVQLTEHVSEEAGL